ncbi:putative V-type proton ATPase subunit C 1-B [Blattamonas nauphoetae]|uniref:V-type proton ATPase subunit C n=1 Tax=Blattamonas nauphoetae TaxID=2049346 RepID=A0ABQ9YKT3_9EUKA|nr:putative V-type proton ATPase subunit C 1-B [Blattamonas nauphoetae]
MESYFVVSLPGNPDPQTTFSQLQSAIGGIEPLHKLNIPELKVGTLDTLLTVGDSIEKFDQNAQQICFRLEKQIYEFQQNEDLIEVNKNPISSLLTNFKWDDSKYHAATRTLPSICEELTEEIARIDQQMKDRAQDFNATKTQITSIARRQSGTIAARNLAEFVTKEDIVETEKLTTLFFVIPKSSVKEWTKTYDTLTDFVVPFSSRRLAEDDQSVLFTVVLFKNVADEYKSKARELKYLPRDFTYTGETAESLKQEEEDLQKKYSQQLAEYMAWCKNAYEEALLCWIHLKVIRVFVESVLRYGLPVNFQAVVILPKKKTTKKIIEVLSEKYKDGSYSSLITDDGKQKKKKEKVDFKEGDESQLYPFVFINCPLLARMVSSR